MRTDKAMRSARFRNESAVAWRRALTRPPDSLYDSRFKDVPLALVTRRCGFWSSNVRYFFGPPRVRADVTG